MKSENKNKQVAEKIIAILRGGLTLSEDTQHYIDSTFSNPAVEELEGLLQDESSCEADPLMELLFFPDEYVQLQLEELLDGTPFQERDEKEIEDIVFAKSLQTHFRFPDGQRVLQMAAAPSNIAQFIARLNLKRQLHPKLSSAIARYVDQTRQIRCKVRFRNTRPISSPTKISFLEAFFEKLQFEANDFFEYLDFALSFLDELTDEADMFQALMAKKRFYLQSLQKAKKLDIQLAKHNMETLLLRGKRVSYIDRADARRKIQMIDRISISLYGKTDFFDLLPADEQSMALSDKNDIDKLMKELS